METTVFLAADCLASSMERDMASLRAASISPSAAAGGAEEKGWQGGFFKASLKDALNSFAAFLTAFLASSACFLASSMRFLAASLARFSASFACFCISFTCFCASAMERRMASLRAASEDSCGGGGGTQCEATWGGV